MEPILWWHDYQHGTNPVVTWLLAWDVHCGDMTAIMIPTWLRHYYHHRIFIVVAWLPLWYLHCGDMTTIMLPTLWWHDYHCCIYTMLTWLLIWYLQCGDMTTIVLPTLWWHDSQQTTTVVTCWSGWDLPCGDMIYHGIYTVVTLQPSSILWILWWHDYQHQTNTVVTWLLEGDVHFGDMTTIMVPTLWNLYCGSTTSNMRFTLKWPDCCQRTTIITVTTLWWLD